MTFGSSTNQPCDTELVAIPCSPSGIASSSFSAEYYPFDPNRQARGQAFIVLRSPQFALPKLQPIAELLPWLSSIADFPPPPLVIGRVAFSTRPLFFFLLPEEIQVVEAPVLLPSESFLPLQTSSQSRCIHICLQRRPAL
jgi:hypothetical protein